MPCRMVCDEAYSMPTSFLRREEIDTFYLRRWSATKPCLTDTPPMESPNIPIEALGAETDSCVLPFSASFYCLP